MPEPDTHGIHTEWPRLILVHTVLGVQVHEARLAAAMNVHGASHLLTLNVPDFARYPGITALHPQDVWHSVISRQVAQAFHPQHASVLAVTLHWFAGVPRSLVGSLNDRQLPPAAGSRAQEKRRQTPKPATEEVRRKTWWA